MSRETTVVECQECGDRKLIEHPKNVLPTVWCSHIKDERDLDPFTSMKPVEDDNA